MFLNTISGAASPLVASALVAAGGAIGAVGRYQLGRLITSMVGEPAARSFPWATLTINIAGCLAMGLLAGWLARQGTAQENLRLLFGVGILGGFTTFSTFGLELLMLAERGAAGPAFAYAAASVLAGLAAVFVGMMIARGAA